MDDIIITGNDEEEMKKLKAHLAREFEIKDLDKLRYFLGMKIARTNNELLCHMQVYF